jgi:hypothetical protein
MLSSVGHMPIGAIAIPLKQPVTGKDFQDRACVSIHGRPGESARKGRYRLAHRRHRYIQKRIDQHALFGQRHAFCCDTVQEISHAYTSQHSEAPDPSDAGYHPDRPLAVFLRM